MTRLTSHHLSLLSFLPTELFFTIKEIETFPLISFLFFCLYSSKVYLFVCFAFTFENFNFLLNKASIIVFSVYILIRISVLFLLVLFLTHYVAQASL